MALAHRPEHDLVGLHRALQPYGRVLDREPGQRTGQLVLVVARGGADGDGKQRLGQVPRLDGGRSILRGQRVRGLGLGQLRHVHELAGDRDLHRGRLDPGRHRQGTDALVVVVVGVRGVGGTGEQAAVARDVDDVVDLQRAVVDAYERQAACELVGRRADDLGDERAVRVAGQRLELLAVGRRDAEPVRAGLRERVLDHGQQLVGADAVEGVDRYDGVEAAVEDRGQEIGEQLVLLELVALEVAVHEIRVLGLLDDPLDELGAVLLDDAQLRRVGGSRHEAARAVVVDLLRDERQVAGDLAAVDERDVAGLYGLAELVLEVGEGGVERGPAVVELGHDDGARHADRGALVPERGGCGVDAVTGGDHEHGRVGGAQGCAELAHEVRMARRIEEVEDDVARTERC